MYVRETLVACATVLSCFYGVTSLFRLISRRRRQSPGPVGYPFLGMLSKIGNFNVIHKTLTTIGKQYGRFFQFKILGKKMVVLRSVSIVETAFEDSSLTDRKETFFQKYVFNGKGFAFANYQNYVPELRDVFHHAMYCQRDIPESSDQVFLGQTNGACDRMLRESLQDFNPDPVIKELMAQIFSYEELDPQNSGKFTVVVVYGSMNTRAFGLISETFKLNCRLSLKKGNHGKLHWRPPGPTGLPVLGHVNINEQQIITKWSKRHGDLYKFKILGKSVYVISNPDILRKAFSSDYLNDRATNSTCHVFNGRRHLGFADYNENTVSLRNILRENVLSYQMKQGLLENNLHRASEEFINNCLKINEDINIDPLIMDCLSDLNSVLLIGETLPEDDPDRKSLWQLIDYLYTLLDPSNDVPLRALPFLRFLPGKYGTIFKQTIAARDRVARRYFDTQKSSYEEGRVRGLVDVCLKIQQEDIRTNGESWLTDDYIKGLMYDTVAAGMSEMMKSIRMLILLTCHHRDVQSKVRAEIDDVIGNTTPNSTHRLKMPYTEAVLLEMLRYVSQTPLAIPHKCNKDVVLDGYLIEKNSGIFPNIWGIHHDETVWGDPWVFRPDRFLTDDGQLLPEDHKLRRTLIPFSVGKRRCPGEQFAMSRLFLLFTSMLQRIEFQPPISEELPSPDPRLYTNKYPLHLPEFKCRAIPRGESN